MTGLEASSGSLTQIGADLGGVTERTGKPNDSDEGDPSRTGAVPAAAQPADPSRTGAVPAAAPPADPPTAPTGRRRPGRTIAIVAVAALMGAAVGATFGALVALHVGRHPTTTIVRDIVPAPDRVAGINDIPSILARVEPTVVSITTDEGSGSGLIVTPAGEVLTNYHVIAGANYLHVRFFHQAGYKTASIVGYDQTDDLALLQVQHAGNLAAAVFGNSDDVQIGANVLAVGNALDLPGGLTATAGIVSAVGRTIDSSALPVGETVPPDLIESDAAINPGNSGGPLVDADGQVIGINTLLINNLAFAIPVDTVKALLPALSAGSRAAAVTLGIGLQDDTGQLANEYGLGVTRGALVSEVAPGSPAAVAGVKVYDVIVGFGGQPVGDSAQLIGLLAGRHAGDVVPMTVIRGKRTLHLRATVAAVPSTGS
jgi:putative serine protease PepD